MKRCTKCGVEKPATTQYFYYVARTREHLESSCQECRKAYQRAYHRRFPAVMKRGTIKAQRQNRAVRRAALERGVKVQLGRPGQEHRCAKCGESKPRTEEFFGMHLRNPDGLNYTCRVCCNERSHEHKWRERHVRSVT